MGGRLATASRKRGVGLGLKILSLQATLVENGYWESRQSSGYIRVLPPHCWYPKQSGSDDFVGSVVIFWLKKMAVILLVEPLKGQLDSLSTLCYSLRFF
jgi:hypothetical protein